MHPRNQHMSSITVSCEADDEAAWFSLHVASAGELPFYVRRQWSELRALAVEVRQPHARVLQPGYARTVREHEAGHFLVARAERH